MGGGSLIRTVARAAFGSTAPFSSPPTAVPASSSSTLCKELQCQSTILSYCSGPASINVSATSKHTDLQDWELTECDESFQSEPKSRLIFGSVEAQEEHNINDSGLYRPWKNIFSVAPTREEAAVATSVLENAISMGLNPTSTACQDTGFPCNSTPAVQPHLTRFSITDTMLQQEASSDCVEPQILMMGPSQTGSSAMCAALHLFKYDATVKETVKSIVSDQSIWDAMMKNEKVQELMRGSKGPQIDDNHEARQDAYSSFNSMVFDLISAILCCTKLAGAYLKEKVIGIMRSITLFWDKSFMPEEYQGLDERLKSCFMLSVIVLALVLVIRAHA